MPTMNQIVATLALILAAGSLASAQAKPEPADPLRGPTVKAPAEAATLIRRNGEGKIERLDTRAEQAAVDLLKLSAEEKKPVDALWVKRAADVHALLMENFDLFLQIQGTRQAGDRAGAQPLIRQLRPAAESLLVPPMVDRVADAIPETQRAAYRRLVSEYNEAVFAEDAANNPPPGDAPRRPNANPQTAPDAKPAGDDAMNPAAKPADDAAAPKPPQRGQRPNAPERPRLVAERMEMNTLLREMARTLNTIVQERKARTEEIIKACDATPEQEEQIRKLVRSEGEKNGPRDPSNERRGDLMVKILQILSPEQRTKLRNYLRGNLPAASTPVADPAAKPAAPTQSPAPAKP